MARWSFGLRQLFLWTAAVALGLVALRSASETWVAAMLGLTFVTLTASILVAVFRQGPQRAFWMGFATFGWAYLLLLLVSWTLGRSTPNDSPLRAQNLVTQRLTSGAYHWLYDKAFAQYQANSTAGAFYGPMSGGGYVGSGMMPGDAAMSGDSGASEGASQYDPDGGMAGGMSMGPGLGGGYGGPPPPPGPPPGPGKGDFLNVAHSLWTLLLAALGGCLAWWLHQTGQRKPGSDSVGA